MPVATDQQMITERVQYHLDQALESSEAERKDFYIRTALQFLTTDSET